MNIIFNVVMFRAIRALFQATLNKSMESLRHVCQISPLMCAEKYSRFQRRVSLFVPLCPSEW